MKLPPARKLLSGRALVATASLALAAVYLALLAAHGFNEEGMRALVRASARCSFALFVLAFAGPAAAPLRAAAPFALWARLNRPYLLASLAASHTAHAVALAGLAYTTGGDSLGQRPAFDYVGGGLAYAFIYFAAADSLTGGGGCARRAVSAAGLYYVWLVFMNSYGGRALDSAAYLPFALVLLAALALRLYADTRARSLARAAG